MMNLDRNECNLLVTAKHNYCEAGNCCESAEKETCWRLVPIDHGLSIPDSLAVSSYEIAWLNFAQAHEPFSQKSLEYICKLDAKADIKMLESMLPFRPVCLRNMRISTLLLQVGAREGLTLA